MRRRSIPDIVGDVMSGEAALVSKVVFGFVAALLFEV